MTSQSFANQSSANGLIDQTSSWNFGDITMATITAFPHTITSPPLAFSRVLEAISDEDCVSMLADAVDEHDANHLDDAHLDNVARLIARLAVPIEL
jgi:hypothetical protein